LDENSSELTELRRIIKRLDVLINIMLMSTEADSKLAMSKKIEILNAAGLRSIEIADILGISPTNVSVRLNQLRKKSAKQNK